MCTTPRSTELEETNQESIKRKTLGQHLAVCVVFVCAACGLTVCCLVTVSNLSHANKQKNWNHHWLNLFFQTLFLNLTNLH